MDAKVLAQYKELLLAKRRELLTARASTLVPIPRAAAPWGDAVDHAAAEIEAEVQVHLRQTNGRLLRAIEAALARIEQAKYGICEVCGDYIAPARLSAVPWTRLCRVCKEPERT